MVLSGVVVKVLSSAVVKLFNGVAVKVLYSAVVKEQ